VITLRCILRTKMEDGKLCSGSWERVLLGTRLLNFATYLCIVIDLSKALGASVFSVRMSKKRVFILFELSSTSTLHKFWIIKCAEWFLVIWTAIGCPSRILFHVLHVVRQAVLNNCSCFGKPYCLLCPLTYWIRQTDTQGYLSQCN